MKLDINKYRLSMHTTPIEHDVVGSSVDPKYHVCPSMPMSVYDAPVEKRRYVAEEANSWRSNNEFITPIGGNLNIPDTVADLDVKRIRLRYGKMNMETFNVDDPVVLDVLIGDLATDEDDLLLEPPFTKFEPRYVGKFSAGRKVA